MYVLIREYGGLDNKMRETATHKANTELRPLLVKSEGFVSYELIQPDEKNDTVASISVFDTRANGEASSKVAGDWVRSNLPSLSTPANITGELVSH
jgi:heme-degrading monooxygenase HmoA